MSHQFTNFQQYPLRPKRYFRHYKFNNYRKFNQGSSCIVQSKKRSTNFKNIPKIWNMFDTKLHHDDCNFVLQNSNIKGVASTLLFNPFAPVKNESDMKDETDCILPLKSSEKVLITSLRLSGIMVSHVASPVYIRIILISTYLKQIGSGWLNCNIPIWRNDDDDDFNGFITDHIDYNKSRIIVNKLYRLSTNNKARADKLFSMTAKINKFFYPNKQEGGNTLGKLNNLYWIVQVYSESSAEGELISSTCTFDVNYKVPN